MTMHAVKIYKLNNLEWVFDDPGRNIYAEAFRAGADTMIDKILEHEHLDPEGDLVFQFSTGTWEPYEDIIYKLYRDDDKNKQLKEGQGAFYEHPNFVDYTKYSLWLSPRLLDYYDEPPGAIYVRIIGDHLDV
mgnify:CR=1 FL=1